MEITMWRLEIVQNDSLYGNAVRGDWHDKASGMFGDFHFALEDAPPGVSNAAQALVLVLLRSIERDLGIVENIEDGRADEH